MDGTSELIVLRGNSGSGKSTVAGMLQERMGGARCLVVAQDDVREDMLREEDVPGGLNIELIETIASWGLDRGLTVVVEGALDAGRYQRMLERLRRRAARSCFVAWDLDFDETVSRHAQRPEQHEFTPDEMSEWYHEWQPLDFVDEIRLGASVEAPDAVDRIIEALDGRSSRAADPQGERRA